MRCGFLALAGLVLGGCLSQSPDVEYSRSRNLLESEKYNQALHAIDDAMQRSHRESDARSNWRFRLLKAEVLIAQRRAAEVPALLSRDPPDGPEWTEIKARTLLLRGAAAYWLANYEEAGELLRRAAELAGKSGSSLLRAEIELRQAVLQVNQGHFTEAEAGLRGVIHSASELHDTYLQAAATGNLGYALLSASKYDESIVWLERARELHAELGANEAVARDNGNLGSCYYRLGDYQNAQRHYEQAQAGFAKTNNRFEQQAWIGNAGNVQFDEGDYRGAAAAYRQAIEIARNLHNDDWTSRWEGNLASASIKQGDWDGAERYNNEALTLERRLGNSLFEAWALSNAGRIALGRRNFAEAERDFRDAMSKPAEDPRVKLDSMAGLAAVYEQTKRPKQAEAEFQAALASIDRLDASLIKEDYKFGYLASLIDFYRIYIDFLMGQGEPRRGLEVAESSRSHVLAQKIGRTDGVRTHTAEAYQRLARDTNSVLLEYWLGEERSYLWAVTPGRIQYYELPSAGRLRPLLESYRAVTMAGRDPLQAAGETGRKLYEALLAPAANELCAGCRIVVVPDQNLYSINLETLPAAPGGQLWIEQANLRIAPSLSYLLEAARERRSASGKSLLVLGDPVVSLPEYPKLEYASREMESIMSSVGGAGAVVVKGADARPDSYRQSQPGRFGLIHFSAHATANAQSPLDSAVILSGPPDRCKLFARDVMAVPLNAELVTISACQSAGAKTYAGEGLVGFAWAFLRAGARNVIAGLWDVNDRSTEQLMSRLYAEVARGSTPGDALRAAKLALIHGGGSYAKPYYWAPFQVYSAAIE